MGLPCCHANSLESSQTESAIAGCCRTEKLAGTSEIKQIAYSPKDVLSLFDVFKQEVSKTLIFLKASNP